MYSMDDRIKEAKEVLAYYTLAAVATGAVPVPASSGAIVVENGVMITHIASVMGVGISFVAIRQSIGLMGALNIFGRTVFVEGAKLLSWGTGSFWAAAGLCGLGATAAGIQTYLIGRLAIEIGRNGGAILDNMRAKQTIQDARDGYDSFVQEWKRKQIKKPVAM